MQSPPVRAVGVSWLVAKVFFAQSLPSFLVKTFSG